MSGNSNPKLTITSDLRTRVIQKFTLLHSKLQTNVSPEQLERSCYEKANNEQEAYLRLCNSLVTNRTRLLETKGNIVPNNQVRTVMNSNFRPNIVGQINNIEPDPINALTNLTVTAGQPNQITMQPGHQQINYRINSAPQPGIMQLNSISPQMSHQRLMVSGNNIRQLDQFGMSQQHQMSPSPNAQLMTNQMPNAQMQVHTLGQVNAGNINNTIRIINKGSSMKPEQIISTNQPMQSSPYQIDSNGGPIVNQHISQVMHGSVSRSPGMRMVSNSPRMISQHQSPQEHYPMSAQISSTTSSVASISAQPEEPQAPPPQTQTPSNPSSQPASAPSIKSPLSEQETAQVKEEMIKLSAKYYKSLSLAVENPMNTSLETLKVWSVLRDLLDTSKPCNKPISMKHVAKIKLFSEKAEEHVKLHQLDPTKTPRRTGPGSSASASTTPGAAPMSGSDVSGVGSKSGTGSDGDPSGGQNQAQTLESAMDKVIHDINNQDIRHKRKVRDSLINHIKTKCPHYMYMLPRHLPPTESENMDTSESKFDEHEFDFIERLPIDSVEEELPPVSHRAFDNAGLLRTDRAHCVSESGDLAGELMLLSGEFEIVSLEQQVRGPGWTCADTEPDWDRNSLFYSIKMRQPLDRELPAEVPPITVRIPEDYEHSLAADWNVNISLYPSPNSAGASEAEIFLLDVLVAFQDEMSTVVPTPWNSVSLLYILSIYKRSIHVGFSNYTLRNQLI